MFSIIILLNGAGWYYHADAFAPKQADYLNKTLLFSIIALLSFIRWYCHGNASGWM